MIEEGNAIALGKVGVITVIVIAGVLAGFVAYLVIKARREK